MDELLMIASDVAAPILLECPKRPYNTANSNYDNHSKSIGSASDCAPWLSAADFFSGKEGGRREKRYYIILNLTTDVGFLDEIVFIGSYVIENPYVTEGMRPLRRGGSSDFFRQALNPK